MNTTYSNVLHEGAEKLKFCSFNRLQMPYYIDHSGIAGDNARTCQCQIQSSSSKSLSHALYTWCGAASLLAHHLSDVAVEVSGDLDGVIDVYM